MNNLKMFCLSLEPNHCEFIKSLGYMPVGLGEKDFDQNWITDKSGIKLINLDDGEVVASYTMSNGLSNNEIYNLFIDNQYPI